MRVVDYQNHPTSLITTPIVVIELSVFDRLTCEAASFCNVLCLAVRGRENWYFFYDYKGLPANKREKLIANQAEQTVYKKKCLRNGRDVSRTVCADRTTT